MSVSSTDRASITPLTDSNTGQSAVTKNETSGTGIAQAALFGPTRALTKARGFFDRVTTTISSIFGPPPTFSSAVQGCFKLDNINRTANAFLVNTQLTGQIDANFNTQVNKLQSWVNNLPITGNNALEASEALLTLCGLISRYNSDAFGGFKGIDFSASDVQNLKNAVKNYHEAEDKLEVAKAELKACDENEELRSFLEIAAADAETNLKEAKKELETQANSLKNAAAVMLGKLSTAGQSKVTARGWNAAPRAQFLNEMQKVSLGAWIFNDIRPAFRDAGVNTNLPADLEATEALNKNARQTTMFSEVNPWKDFGPKGNWTDTQKEIVKQWNEFFGKEGLFPGTKPGLRGRGGWGDKTKDTHTPSAPVCNTTDLGKKQSKDSQKASLISPDTHPELKAGHVPPPTARRTAVPQEVCDALNTDNAKPDDEKKYSKLANYLKKEGVIEKDEAGKWQPVPSFAAVIDNAELPTYCSVSGTTGELVCSLLTTADPQTQKELKSGLEELLLIAVTGKGQRGFNISKFVEPIATFMEVGHFHTTAEVLGGFLSVAVANFVQQGGKPPSAAKMQEMFTNLLNYFKTHPQQFLSGAPAALQSQAGQPPSAIAF